MSTRLVGILDWDGEIDEQGFTTYTITWLIESSYSDGPAAVLRTVGLPFVGDLWIINNGQGGLDIDEWAFFHPGAKAKYWRRQPEDGRHKWWTVEAKASTKPIITTDRTLSGGFGDPLTEPPRVSGQSIRYTEIALLDRFGAQITNSSHELLRGPENEWDANRDQVTIEHWVPQLQSYLWGPMRDTVNFDTLWGLPPRSIKLSDVKWSKEYFQGLIPYYKRTYVFDIWVKINDRTGALIGAWDRDLLDEGNMVLNGHWADSSTLTGHSVWILDDINGSPPDPTNPAHFHQYMDRKGNPSRAILDGHGKPINNSVGGAIADLINSGSSLTTVITEEPHGLSDGDRVSIVGAPLDYAGKANGVSSISLLSTNSFQIPRGPVQTSSNDDWQITDGHGAYWKNLTPAKPGRIHIEKHNESDFLLLGIPLTF